MGAESDSNRIRLVCIGNEDDYTPTHVRKWMETEPLIDVEITVDFDSDLSNSLTINSNPPKPSVYDKLSLSKIPL